MQERPLAAFLPLGEGCGDGRLARDPALWLPQPVSVVDDHAWVVRLHVGPLSHSVVCRIGAAWRDGLALWRPLSWTPSDRSGRTRMTDRTLPTFTGELGCMGGSTATLVLSGTYGLPAGRIGEVADRAGLDRAATASARRFLEDVARALTRVGVPALDTVPLREGSS